MAYKKPETKKEDNVEVTAVVSSTPTVDDVSYFKTLKEENDSLKKQMEEMQAQLKMMAEMISASKNTAPDNSPRAEKFIPIINLSTGVLVLRGTTVHTIEGQFASVTFREREARAIMNNARNVFVKGYAWIADEEFMKEYDLDIANDVVFQMLSNLLADVNQKRVKRILLTIGGDMLNADNMAGTTVKGTPQDNCTDYFSTVRGLYDMMVRVVDVLRQIAPVDILYIPANHDMTSSFQLSQYLKAWYKADKNVRIDDSPLPRKYYKYGDTLLVFAHDGDVKRLPGLIADEARDKWSRVKFTDVFLQHLHSEKVLLEENHMRIQRLPTLCAKSAWTVDQGYNAARQHKSFIYDVQGLRQVIYTTL